MIVLIEDIVAVEINVSKIVIELEKVTLDNFELASVGVGVTVVIIIVDFVDVVILEVVDIFTVLVVVVVILIGVREAEVVEVSIIVTKEDVEAGDVKVSEGVIELDKVALDNFEPASVGVGVVVDFIVIDVVDLVVVIVLENFEFVSVVAVVVIVCVALKVVKVV